MFYTHQFYSWRSPIPPPPPPDRNTYGAYYLTFFLTDFLRQAQNILDTFLWFYSNCDCKLRGSGKCWMYKSFYTVESFEMFFPRNLQLEKNIILNKEDRLPKVEKTFRYLSEELMPFWSILPYNVWLWFHMGRMVHMVGGWECGLGHNKRHSSQSYREFSEYIL